MKLSKRGAKGALASAKRERLPTNTLSSGHRVQRWANFIAGYSIEFVDQCLAGVPPKSGPVLDPFAGCGTTLVAAKNLGHQAIGTERNPVFHALAAAKLRSHTVDEVARVSSGLAQSSEIQTWSPDAEAFLAKLFQPEELVAINAASASIACFDEELRPLAVLIFLRACELSCGAQTDGIYKAPTSRKSSMQFSVALRHVVAELIEDVSSDWYRECWARQPNAQVFNSSSLSLGRLQEGSIAACVTSPPYLNNFDYAEMTRMQLYLLGWAQSWGEITRGVRNHLITNTTTALKGKKSAEYQSEARAALPLQLADELDGLVQQLRHERSVRPGKKDYDYLIYPYYSEINEVLRGVHRALRPGATLDWVVADAALYGVHIRTHLHTAALLADVGFHDITIQKMRSRGTRWVLNKRDGAKEGLGEYHIKARKSPE